LPLPLLELVYFPLGQKFIVTDDAKQEIKPPVADDHIRPAAVRCGDRANRGVCSKHLIQGLVKLLHHPRPRLFDPFLVAHVTSGGTSLAKSRIVKAFGGPRPLRNTAAFSRETSRFARKSASSSADHSARGSTGP